MNYVVEGEPTQYIQALGVADGKRVARIQPRRSGIESYTESTRD